MWICPNPRRKTHEIIAQEEIGIAAGEGTTGGPEIIEGEEMIEAAEMKAVVPVMIPTYKAIG
jgi:hypothetical protein